MRLADLAKFFPFVSNATLAAATLVCSMSVAYLYGQAAFGLFSIFVVTNAVAQSLFSASFINPFVKQFQRFNDSCEVYVRTALIFALLVFFLLQILFYSLLTEVNISLMLSFAGVVTQLRNYYKSLNISRINVLWSYLPDSIFSGACFFVIPFLFINKYNFSFFVLLYLLLSIASLLFCFYKEKFSLEYGRIGFLRFLAISKSKCIHSFFSSFFIEVINNGYNFAIVFFYGTVVYSNFSLAFMFLRPLTLVTMTLNQIYRAHLTKEPNKSYALFRSFFLINTSVLMLNLAVVAALAYLFLDDVSDSYDKGLVINAFLIMILISFVRYLKSWCIINAQSQGDFSKISKIAIPNSILCAISLALVGYLNLEAFCMTLVLLVFEVFFLYGFRNKG